MISKHKKVNKQTEANAISQTKGTGRRSRFVCTLSAWIAKIRQKTPLPVKALVSLVALPCLLNFALNLYYFSCNPYDGKRDFSGVLFSFLLTVTLSVFLTSLCKKAKIACLIQAPLYFILGFGNQLKIAISNLNPLFIDDMLFAGDTQTLKLIVKHSDLSGILADILPQTLLFLFLTVLFVLLSWILDFTLSKRKLRVPTVILSCVLLVFTYLPIQPINTFLYNSFFAGEKEHNAIDYYSKEGMLSGITAQYLGIRIMAQDASEKEYARQLLAEQSPAEQTPAEQLPAQAPEVTGGEWGTPNIIMVFSESFFDLAKLEDVTFSKEITPNLTALRQEGISFDMLSPTFGGLSCNAEYQILTSGNLSYFPLGYVPYPMLYDAEDETCAQYPSAIRELAQNGYRTKIVSTWARNLCNCNEVYNCMQVDEFVYDYCPEVKGLYTSDASVADMVVEVFEEKTDTSPLFLMAMTAQAHMPYYSEKYQTYDIDITSSPLTESENQILLSYAQGIYDADAMLGELYRYINTLNEPTLLVFYGDHLPILTNGSRDIYPKLSYFNTDDPFLNETRKYMTEGLILANFPLEDEIDYLGQDLLMPYIFSKTDMELSPYYRYLISTVETLPAFNTFAAFDARGTLCPVDGLACEEKAIYEARRSIQALAFSLYR